MANDLGFAHCKIDTEKALSQHRQELAAMHANAPVIMMMVDAQPRVWKSHAHSSSFAGRTSGEMIGLLGGEAMRCIQALNAAEGRGAGAAL